MKTKSAMVAAMVAFAGFAAEVTWIGVGENSIAEAGDWNTPSNWSTGAVPGTGDTAKVGSWVKISGKQTIECDIEASASANLVIPAGATVTLNGSLKIAGGIEVETGGKLITRGAVTAGAGYGFNTTASGGGTWRVESATVPTPPLYFRGGVLELASAAEFNLYRVEYENCKVLLAADAKLSGAKEIKTPLEIDLNGCSLEMLNAITVSAGGAVTVMNGNAQTPGTIVYKGKTAASLTAAHDASIGKVNVAIDTAEAFDVSGATFGPTDKFVEGEWWNGTLEFRSGAHEYTINTVAQMYADKIFKSSKVRWYVRSAQDMARDGLAVSEFELLSGGAYATTSAKLLAAAKIYKLDETGEVAGDAISDPAGNSQKIEKMFDSNTSGGSKWYLTQMKNGGNLANGICVEFDFGEEELVFDGYRWAGADARQRDPRDVELKVFDSVSGEWTSVLGGAQVAAQCSATGAWHPGYRVEATKHVSVKIPLVITAPASLTVNMPEGENGLRVSGNGELSVAIGSAPITATAANGSQATVKSTAEAICKVDLGGDSMSVTRVGEILNGMVRYIRWRILSVRDGDQMAVGEFQLTKNGKYLRWPEGTTVESTIAPVAGNPLSNLVDNKISKPGMPLTSVGERSFKSATAVEEEDGSSVNRVYITGLTADGVDLIIALPQEVDFDGYCWYTSFDSPGRDPKKWVVSVSSDKQHWKDVSEVDYVFPGDEQETPPEPNGLIYGHKAQKHNSLQGRGELVAVLNDSATAVAAPFAVQIYSVPLATDVLADAEPVILAGRAELAFVSANETAGVLSGSGTLSLAGGSRLTINTCAKGDGGAFSGTINGDGVLEIAGNCVQDLNGATLAGVREIVLSGGTLTGKITATHAVKVTFAGGAWGAELTMAEGDALTLATDGTNKAKFKLPETGIVAPLLTAFTAENMDDASREVFMAGEAFELSPRWKLRKIIQGDKYILKGGKRGLVLMVR